MTQNSDIRIHAQSISQMRLLEKTLRYVRARSRIIGGLISFKSRDGRFVFLESLLDYLAGTKGVPGLDGFRIDTDTCLNHVKNTRAACDAQWTFGDDDRWESDHDQCCGILALHNPNWTAGKRIPTADIVRWAINDRINRLLVLCLPPEDFVAPHEQTWEAVCEEVPWKVTERYVRLSYLGDVLPWLREKVLPVAEAEDAVLALAVAQCVAHIELRPALSAGDCGAAIREAEILQRIEIEIDFQARLAAAFDKEGYFVENFKTPDERAEATIRGEQENEPDRILLSWGCFRVHSKDASVPFWLTVWFSSDKSSLPQSFSNWRALCGDGMSESGPSKTKEWKGVSFNDATLPLCCHLSIIDARLRFETLPLPVMRDTLLGGHLAEELASKVAIAFECICAKERAGIHYGRLTGE